MHHHGNSKAGKDEVANNIVQLAQVDDAVRKMLGKFVYFILLFTFKSAVFVHRHRQRRGQGRQEVPQPFPTSPSCTFPVPQEVPQVPQVPHGGKFKLLWRRRASQAAHQAAPPGRRADVAVQGEAAESAVTKRQRAERVRS